MIFKMTELLAPVGDWSMLQAAINAGADAVYFGITGFNMRVRAHNFSLDDLDKIVEICHTNKLKAYLALNTIVYDSELHSIDVIISAAAKAGIDAIICWDMAVIQKAIEKGIPVHISTQASISNFSSLRAYANLGATRGVLARELTLDQIKTIIASIDDYNLEFQVETFIHGAMCVSYSGRCFLSQFLFCKSANRGECLQPCRRSYTVKDHEENHNLQIEPNYVLSPKDLCTMPFIDMLLDARINALKIEGRARSPEYVYVTVSAYREAIDLYKQGKLDIDAKNRLTQNLKEVYHRGFSSGFYMGKPIDQWSKSYGSTSSKSKIYIGRVTNYYKQIGVAEVLLEARDLYVTDKLLIIGNKSGTVFSSISSMYLNEAPVSYAPQRTVVGIKIDKIVRPNDKVYVWSDRIEQQ